MKMNTLLKASATLMVVVSSSTIFAGQVYTRTLYEKGVDLGNQSCILKIEEKNSSPTFEKETRLSITPSYVDCVTKSDNKNNIGMKGFAGAK